MIELLTIAQNIESALNTQAEADGIPQRFRIFADAGKYKAAARNGNTVTEYINGVVTAVSSEVIPYKGGIKVASQMARLELMVGIADGQVYETYLAPIKACMNSVFQTPTVKELEDESGEKYSASITYTLTNINDYIEQRQGIGLSIPFVAYVEISYVTNGVNSDNIIVTWKSSEMAEAVQIPYLVCQLTRSMSPDTQVYANSGGVQQSKQISTTFGLDITVPVIKPTQSVLMQKILKFVLTGENTVADVTINVSGETTTKKMIFGSTTTAIEGVQNAGLQFALVEARV